MWLWLCSSVLLQELKYGRGEVAQGGPVFDNGAQMTKAFCASLTEVLKLKNFNLASEDMFTSWNEYFDSILEDANDE